MATMRLMITAMIAGMLMSSAATADAGHPDFTGMWTRGRTADTPFKPPPSGPGPVLSQVLGKKAPVNSGAEYRWGDYTAPILQPWAREVVRAHTESERAGKPVRSAKETCWPMGTPYIDQLNERAEILQQNDHFVFLYEELMQQRFVRINAAHPANLKPTWFGDSVAHWEGDTLVVDTVGIDKRSWVDSFGTPHTDQMHVVERFHLRNPDLLEVLVSVEDAGAFTTPWSGIATYRKDRAQQPYTELVCPEYDFDASTGEFFPVPAAKKADF